jgi:serine/threonine protein kinase/Tol biopolymer transport system component
LSDNRWQQIEDIFHRAVALTPDARSAFLSQSCGANQSLRREVESLLAHESEDGSTFVGPPRDAAPESIAHYRITGTLGEGGMGVVYRAIDTKLGRNVAIKVLPAVFAHNAERMARFQREAEVLASLNHPNIAAIYGVAESNDARGLVMELVEGETLPVGVPLDTALRYAKQMAEALEYAHERGVVHRDLKPDNVKVTSEGAVKLLDFGLAKAIEDPSPARGDPATLPAMTLGATRVGVVLGTAPYMSPEQAGGKPADRRADIWSFGAVLYEILAGQRAFPGESAPEALANVLKLDPDWSALPVGTPPTIRKLIERCLKKDRKQRLQAIGEARIAIEESLSGASEVPEVVPVAQKGTLVPWVLAAAFGLALGGVLLYQAKRGSPSRPLIRLDAEVAADMPLARASGAVGGNILALSPDGAHLAVTLRGPDGKVRLHTRLLDQSQVTALAGTENASFPFFSPDGEWIGFYADGKLKKISVEGGAVVTLCDAPNLRGASWGDDGNIIAALETRAVLSRVPATGGKPVPVTKLRAGEITHRWPQVLPGSDAILFTAGAHAGSFDDANIDVISLKTGEQKTVERGGFSPHYVPMESSRTGHLIYLHGSTLLAVPFDIGNLNPTGTPAHILEDVSSTGQAGGDFASAGLGVFVYLPGKGQQTGWWISWVDSTGRIEPLHPPLGVYNTPRFSPDGKRLAVSIARAQGEDIWVKDLDRDTPSRLSFLAGTNRWPVWTPDGKNIVFQSSNPAAPGLYWMRSDGSGEAQRLTNGKLQEIPYSFSPDGKRLAFQQTGNSGSQDIFTTPVEADPGRGAQSVRLGNAELFLGTPFSEVLPAFSPDGRWLAYQSNESGPYEVYVRPFPGPGGRTQISTGGGRYPVWSGAAHELLFETLDGHVMDASYTAKGDTFAAAKPRAWSETRLKDSADSSNYDLAPDGKHLAVFLAGDASSDQKPPTHLTFLLNFFDELQRRAIAAK